ncbi:hypothetical protein J437_LFUL018152 [Ladona fulva]|uniref:Alkylglycerone-phosphate synthase n=1 Tax=Ladona fulva TaxID=123851 RepID=A0A8K0KNQ2_LADFU|nr:hypothetical protein J437_LFUL018152 [Ladona fulva]
MDREVAGHENGRRKRKGRGISNAEEIPGEHNQTSQYFSPLFLLGFTNSAYFTNLDAEFLDEIHFLGIHYSLEGEDRLVRAHGQTLHEVALLRGVPWCVRGLSGASREDGSPLSAFPRIPDLVLWPEKHDHVVHVVEAAQRHDVVLIPFGGGTNVTMAVVCSPEEPRMIVSLDTSQMGLVQGYVSIMKQNHILWIDEDSLMACVESGIIGQDLERELNSKGLTTGHEPDSYEFSSNLSQKQNGLGGWVATRASGMKKNVYGNIEDILVHVKMVTPTGVLQRNCRVPRISCGPDMNHLILGSEGTLGVITEVILKVRPLPETKECGSIIFKDLETGINFLWEVARQVIPYKLVLSHVLLSFPYSLPYTTLVDYLSSTSSFPNFSDPTYLIFGISCHLFPPTSSLFLSHILHSFIGPVLSI